MLYSGSLNVYDTSCRCVKQSQISNCHSFHFWTQQGYKISNHAVRHYIIQLPHLSKCEKKVKKKSKRTMSERRKGVLYFSSSECTSQIQCIFSAGASPIEAGVRIWNTQAIRLPTGYPRGSAAVAMLTRPVIKEANLFNMSMLALLAAINKRRPQECCVCFFSAPGCFHLVCIFSGFHCLVIQQSFFLLLA